jgi:hypothetical protein
MTKASPKHPKPSLKFKDFGIGNQADWFMLVGTDISNKSYPHEVAGADLFVHYYPYLEAWSYEPILFYDPATKKNVRADRGMKLDGKTFFFEVDRDTENVGEIRKKVENYIKYGYETNQMFHVIFDVAVGYLHKANKRLKEIGDYLDTIHRGNQFSATFHTLLTESDITEPVIFTPSGKYPIDRL